MAMRDAFLPEFDQEMAVTRAFLERVPEDKFDWQPHAKSMTLGRLASHLAQMPGWSTMTLTTTELDLNPPGGAKFTITVLNSRAAMLAEFDANVAAARAAIVAATDEELLQPWTLQAAGQTIFTLPRIAVLRSMVMNHTIHHRAQLGIYLRMNDVPVPSAYGPTADEAM